MVLQTTYSQYAPAGFPGMSADMGEWDASTKIASATINFGAPVQRNGSLGCAPFASGGECIGIAKAVNSFTGNGDTYVSGDNVPVANEGEYYGVAGAAIAAGAALNWDVTAQRWTTAATSGTVLAVPQAEAETAAAANGSTFVVRLRRIPS